MLVGGRLGWRAKLTEEHVLRLYLSRSLSALFFSCIVGLDDAPNSFVTVEYRPDLCQY